VADQNGDSKVDFSDLEEEVGAKDGWYFDYSVTGERNLGQAAILGHLVSFTTYVPSNDLCTSEGSSYLYGVYYKTGTAYIAGALLTAENNWTGRDGGTTGGMVLPKVEAGRGYTTTPNLHTGREAGSIAFVQTSTGAIIDIEQVNPGVTKSKKLTWQEGFKSSSEQTEPY
jgi:type IV pilus assembly protein PilY1